MTWLWFGPIEGGGMEGRVCSFPPSWQGKRPLHFTNTQADFFVFNPMKQIVWNVSNWLNKPEGPLELNWAPRTEPMANKPMMKCSEDRIHLGSESLEERLSLLKVGHHKPRCYLHYLIWNAWKSYQQREAWERTACPPKLPEKCVQVSL